MPADPRADRVVTASAEPGSRRLTFRGAEQIQPQAPRWLWPGWLCAQALHLGIGRQGVGKSTFAAWLLGKLSTGAALPGSAVKRGSLRCALLSAEEAADRQVARLEAAGADLDRVVVLGDVEEVDDEGRATRRPWRLPRDCELLERLIREQHVAVVVVDGLGYSVDGDSHNYGVVGSALATLAAAAERSGAAILGLTHPPKGGADPVTAAIGSTAWTAVPRITWLLGRDPGDDRRRVVRVAKTNYREPEAGLGFTITGDERWEVGVVSGLAASDVSTETLAAASMPAEERTARDEARELVRSVLCNGPVETAELLRLTRAAGISDRTVERVRADLGVKATPRHDGGKLVGWVVALPTPPATPPSPLRGGVGGLGGVVVNRGSTECPSDQAAKTAQSASKGVGGGLSLPDELAEG